MNKYNEKIVMTEDALKKAQEYKAQLKEAVVPLYPSLENDEMPIFIRRNVPN